MGLELRDAMLDSLESLRSAWNSRCAPVQLWHAALAAFVYLCLPNASRNLLGVGLSYAQWQCQPAAALLPAVTMELAPASADTAVKQVFAIIANSC